MTTESHSLLKKKEPNEGWKVTSTTRSKNQRSKALGLARENTKSLEGKENTSNNFTKKKKTTHNENSIIHKIIQNPLSGEALPNDGSLKHLSFAPDFEKLFHESDESNSLMKNDVPKNVVRFESSINDKVQGSAFDDYLEKISNSTLITEEPSNLKLKKSDELDNPACKYGSSCKLPIIQKESFEISSERVHSEIDFPNSENIPVNDTLTSDITNNNALKSKLLAFLDISEDEIDSFASCMRFQSNNLHPEVDNSFYRKTESFPKSIMCTNQNESKASHNSSSTNNTSQIATLYVLDCLRNWKLKYPWVGFNCETKEITCSSCSSSSRLYSVMVIKEYENVFSVASELYRHSVSERHLLKPLASSPHCFSELYHLIKLNIFSCSSLNELFFKMNKIVFYYIRTKVPESTLMVFIIAIGSIITDKTVKDLKENATSGVCYVYDQCRNLLIARYFRTFLYPEEHLITSFSESGCCLNDFLDKHNLNGEKVTSVSDAFSCTQCLMKKDFIPFPNSDPLLPVRYPLIYDLLFWLEKDIYFKRYATFIRNISLVFSFSPRSFDPLPGSEIFCKATWENAEVYAFVMENLDIILRICSQIYGTNGYEYAKLSFDRRVCQTDSFKLCISLLNSLSTFTSSDCIFFERGCLKSLTETVFENIKMLQQSTADKPSPFSLDMIKLYVNNLLNTGYSINREKLLEFNIFFRPLILAQLSLPQNAHLRENVKRVYLRFKTGLKAPFPVLLNALVSFGKFLLNELKMGETSLPTILKLFFENPTVKSNFSLVFKLHSLLATLPFYRAKEERSLFHAFSLVTYFRKIFGEDISWCLLSINQEGPCTSESVAELYTKFLQYLDQSND